MSKNTIKTYALLAFLGGLLILIGSFFGRGGAVIGLALVAVLIGARRTLAAPFILGIAALPVEILIVFLVQVGDSISPLLWWITLATAGIVLLVIAVGWERRTGADATLAARIRDLR